MEVTIGELSTQCDQIIAQIGQGFDVIIMHNGIAYAKIIPINNETTETDNAENELFGLWKDRNDMDDVASYFREMRQGRRL